MSSAYRFHSDTKMIGPAPLPPVQIGMMPIHLFPPDNPEQCADLRFSLGEAIACRRTSRDFSEGCALSLQQMSRLLGLSVGRIETRASDNEEPRRAAPSGGALYPIGTDVIVFNVKNLVAGAYRYLPDVHGLQTVRRGDLRKALEPLLLDQPWMLSAAAIWVLSGDSNRVARRYASRGYRYLLLESGHIAQNIYLLGTAFGLGVQATGGFVDDGIKALLGLREGVLPLYLVAIGPIARSEANHGEERVPWP